MTETLAPQTTAEQQVLNLNALPELDQAQLASRMPRDLAQALYRDVPTVWDAACRVNPNAEGMCLVSAAVLGHHIQHVTSVRLNAVHGTFAGEAHWWLEYAGVVIDPTITQFGDLYTERYVGLPMFTEAETVYGESMPYRPEQSFTSGWDTRELVVAEAERAFIYTTQARMFVDEVFDELGHTSASTRS